MVTQFDGTNLRLIRTFRDLTLNDVSSELDLTRQYISSWETNRASPSKEHIEHLAHFLNVRPDFFYKNDTKKVGEHQFHFRKQRTTKVRTKDTIIALGEISRRLVEFIDSHLELPEPNFPNIECLSNSDVERAAEEARRYWDLGLGPIDNMTRVAENAGAVVTDFDGSSEEVDALSICTVRPIIVRNSAKSSPGRLRFDLAHEIGHLIMHDGQITGDKKTESEANRFASSFLLPRSSFMNICPVMNRINWPLISKIKQEYKVSKAAILYRAKELGRVSEQQYINAVIRLRKHEGKHEKDDYLIEPIEQPEMIHNAIATLEEHLGISVSDIEDALDLGKNSLSKVLGGRYLRSTVNYEKYSNVVPFSR